MAGIWRDRRRSPDERARDLVSQMTLDEKLAQLGRVWSTALVEDDAFSAAHRAHASTEGVARLLPSAAGRLMQAELEALAGALTNPERPVIAVVGNDACWSQIAREQVKVSRTIPP